MLKPISDVIQDYYKKNKNGHWFNEDTMQFFGSRLPKKVRLDEAKEKAYFISSELDFHGKDRKYSIRCYNYTNGDIETIGEFRQFKNAGTANYHLSKLLTKEK